MKDRLRQDLLRHLSSELQETALLHARRAAGILGTGDVLSLYIGGGLDLISSGVASAALTASDGKPVDRAMIEQLVKATASDLVRRVDTIFEKVSGKLEPGDRVVVVEA